MSAAARAAARAAVAPLPERPWFSALRRRLPAWYARWARDLPWRGSHDAYRVWLSEIMLQQTQVATVKPYFQRFLQELPTIQALAAADESQVLRLWEGLGYYRRARQLHRAAQVMIAEHGGRFPHEYDAVRRLPGVGRYTAGAILSIAFDQSHPILEANTIRLWCRLLGFVGQSTGAAGQRLLWAAAEAVLPRQGAGRVNQALMDLGSTVCLARAPRCEACPVAVLCVARRTNRQATIPAPKPRPAVERRREAAIVVRRLGRVLLRQCDEDDRWAGLWDFPRFHLPDGESARPCQIVDRVLAATGAQIQLGRRLATIKHGITRFRITLDCYEATCRGRLRGRHASVLRWVRPAELDRYPLNSTARRIARLLADECGPGAAH